MEIHQQDPSPRPDHPEEFGQGHNPDFGGQLVQGQHGQPELKRRRRVGQGFSIAEREFGLVAELADRPAEHGRGGIQPGDRIARPAEQHEVAAGAATDLEHHPARAGSCQAQGQGSQAGVERFDYKVEVRSLERIGIASHAHLWEEE